MRSVRFRYLLGSVLALIGAAAAVWSPFRAWYDGRHGRDFRLEDLFNSTGISTATGELLGSLFLPFVAAAVVAAVALALRSRLLLVVAGLIVLGFTALWMVRQAQEDGSLRVAGDNTGLDHGAAMALGGALLLLLAAAVLPSRKSWRQADDRVSRPAPAATAAAAPTATQPTMAYDRRSHYEPSPAAPTGHERRDQARYETPRTAYDPSQGPGRATSGEHGAQDAGPRGTQDETLTRAWPTPYAAGRTAADPVSAEEEARAGSRGTSAASAAPGRHGSPTRIDGGPTSAQDSFYGETAASPDSHGTAPGSRGSSSDTPIKSGKWHRPHRAHPMHKRP